LRGSVSRKSTARSLQPERAMPTNGIVPKDMVTLPVMKMQQSFVSALSVVSFSSSWCKCKTPQIVSKMNDDEKQ
jgi:hypothetical protein